MLLIELLLKCGFNFGNLLVAEVLLHPAHNELFSQFGIRDHVAGLGLFKADRPIRRAAVSAIVGANCIMHHKYNAVGGVMLHVGDVPFKRGSHKKKWR